MSGDDLYPPTQLLAPSSLAELHERASRPSAAVIELISRVDGDFCVLGAGGKMGFHLTLMLQRAVAAGGGKNRVIAVSRFQTPESIKLFREHNLSICSADLLQDEISTDVRSARTVFYLAGIKFGTANQPELLRRFNVELPLRAVAAFPDANFVALSTGCVYPFVSVQSGGSTEDDSPDPPGDYAASCYGREQAFRQSESSAVLIRLNYSVDLRYGVLVDIATKVWRSEPVDVTTGFINAIWQGDALNYIIQSLSQCSRPPAVLNVTGSEILSVREVARHFGKLFGKTVTISGHESPTAWLNNASRATQHYGPPSVDSKLLMSWVADWIRNERPLLSKPTHFETRSGNF